MVFDDKKKIAVWVITPNGMNISIKIAYAFENIYFFYSKKLKTDLEKKETFQFESLKKSIGKKFNNYKGHIFIMSTGIAVRMIAPHLKDKNTDPAVVVVDDLGFNVISLISGHLGGGNELALKVADIIGANPVITTATDINQVPSIDLLAKKKKLFIENPESIKFINMAFLTKNRIFFHDPYGLVSGNIDPYFISNKQDDERNIPEVFIDDIRVDLLPQTLVLRPSSLTIGIGCNRNTGCDEMVQLLNKILKENSLAKNSIKCLATIDIKHDEKGIQDLADHLGVGITYYNKDMLNQVENISSPSLMAEKYVGAKSVCEAAAILASDQGNLIVPKQTIKNVTLAIARISILSA